MEDSAREGQCRFELKAREWRDRCRQNNSFHPRFQKSGEETAARSQKQTLPCQEPGIQDPQESMESLLPPGKGKLL